MRTIFAISEGSYSDYTVRVLFTTRELAEAHLAEAYGNTSDAYIEEFYLYDEPPKQVVVYNRSGHVASDGRVLAEQNNGNVNWEYNGIDNTRPIMLADTREWNGMLQVRVTGTDAQRVERAYQDRIAQARARQLGLAYELTPEEE
jgi:hypothetical protein